MSLSLVLDTTEQLALRQLAAVMLKQYIDVHWSAESEKFRPPETSPAAKQAIRNMLPMGLKESISKVRNTVAFSLAGGLEQLCICVTLDSTELVKVSPTGTGPTRGPACSTF